MDEFDKPAAPLENPIVGGEDVSSDEAQVLRTGGINAADLVEAQAGVDKAFKAIKAQPTEKIRIPKVHGPQTVIINGARFNVPANVYVNVPRQVAEILRDAGRI